MHLQAPETFLGWDNRHLEGPATSGSKRMFMAAANTNICLSVSLNFNISLEKGLPTPHFVGYLIHWGKKNPRHLSNSSFTRNTILQKQ